MKFVELKKHINAGALFPAYIITGDDAFVSEYALILFKNSVTDFPEFNIQEFTDEKDADKIVESLLSYPVMSTLKLTVANNFLGQADKIISYLDNPNPQSVLIIVSPELKPNLSKLMLKCETVDCGKLTEGEILNFIVKSLDATNNKLTNEAGHLLIEYCSKDMSRITREAQKLAAYKGAGELINASDVMLLVEPESDYKMYELSEAVSDRNGEAAARILKSLLSAKVPPSTIISMLYTHFRRLLFCVVNKGESALPYELGVKEYAVKRMTATAQKFSALKLKRICDLFHEADYAFKSGKMDPLTALETTLMQAIE